MNMMPLRLAAVCAKPRANADAVLVADHRERCPEPRPAAYGSLKRALHLGAVLDCQRHGNTSRHRTCMGDNHHQAPPAMPKPPAGAPVPQPDKST